jgi:hypothetical protein
MCDECASNLLRPLSSVGDSRIGVFVVIPPVGVSSYAHWFEGRHSAMPPPRRNAASLGLGQGGLAVPSHLGAIHLAPLELCPVC